MNASQDKIRISKIEGAKRQLDCAIQRWFADDDALSTHTLAAAAYQIIHDIKNHRGIRKTLLYDSAAIKEEHRKKWIKVVKRPANFLKHADTDPDGTLEFNSHETLALIMAAASGLKMLGEPTSYTVNALTFWLVIHKPSWITSYFRKLYEQHVGVDNLEEFKLIAKNDFLEIFLRTSEATAAVARVQLG